MKSIEGGLLLMSNFLETMYECLHVDELYEVLENKEYINYNYIHHIKPQQFTNRKISFSNQLYCFYSIL